MSDLISSDRIEHFQKLIVDDLFGLLCNRVFSNSVQLGFFFRVCKIAHVKIAKMRYFFGKLKHSHSHIEILFRRFFSFSFYFCPVSVRSHSPIARLEVRSLYVCSFFWCFVFRVHFLKENELMSLHILHQECYNLFLFFFLFIFNSIANYSFDYCWCWVSEETVCCCYLTYWNWRWTPS